MTKPRKANESACPSSVTANPVLIPVYQTIFYCMLTGLQLTLRGMSEALVDKRVAPALVTLSSDPELWVSQTATLSYPVCLFEHSSWSAFLKFNLSLLETNTVYLSCIYFDIHFNDDYFSIPKKTSVPFFFNSNSSVRIATIPAFGTIMETVIQREVRNNWTLSMYCRHDSNTFPIQIASGRVRECHTFHFIS